MYGDPNSCRCKRLGAHSLYFFPWPQGKRSGLGIEHMKPVTRPLRVVLVFVLAAACTGGGGAVRPNNGEPVPGAADDRPPRFRTGTQTGGEDKDGLSPGFEDSRIATVSSPTALAFTPDGRMLVSGQEGKLFSVRSGSAVPVLDLTERTCTKIEQGLLGVAVDPAFGETPHLYLYYTAKRNGTCVNRVSRFTFGGPDWVDKASEAVFIDNIPSKRGNHNGGDLQFGPDGHLYVSVGDGGCDYDGSGCHGKNNASRDRHSLLGKVLRISADGGVPPDNPFRGAQSEPCGAAGRTQAGKVCSETFLWGLRNPFRMAFNRNAGPFTLFVNDPGQDRREEVNEARAGADYGWNLREGRCVNRSRRCGPPPPGLTDPIFDYAHSTRHNCRAITGGAFVPNGTWPAPYGGAYLFADFGCGQIFRLEPRPEGGYRSVKFAGGFGSSSLVHLAFGPEGPGTALYLTSYSGGGEVRRLSYRGTGFSSPGEGRGTA